MEANVKQMAITNHIVFVDLDGVELFALLKMLALVLHAKTVVHARQP